MAAWLCHARDQGACWRQWAPRGPRSHARRFSPPEKGCQG